MNKVLNLSLLSSFNEKGEFRKSKQKVVKFAFYFAFNFIKFDSAMKTLFIVSVIGSSFHFRKYGVFEFN